ncbi:MAG TPA: ferritin-like domain-containing protein [Gemmataceae bacterium]|jgi:bacterioferritin (cytochrome b1)|nr:ferritin-like domain-containing protein [Gemmataceae bacterium]
MAHGLLALDPVTTAPRNEQVAAVFHGPISAEERHSHEWCAYFELNKTRLLDIPWHRGAGLTPDDMTAVIPSLQEFQLGESSEGTNLRRLAEAEAIARNDPLYAVAMRLFIAEEHRHADAMGKFLDLAGVPRLKATSGDFVFRRLRRALGLETMIVVLLTAEIIAKVYYRALYFASESPVLRRICAQLLRDELKHVDFHTERLRLMRRGRAPWRRRLVDLATRTLFGGTCFVVWLRHRRPLRRGGYGLRRFWSALWAEFEKAYGERDVIPSSWTSTCRAPVPGR